MLFFASLFFFFFFLTLDVLVGFVALVVSFFWLGGRRRKSVVALIGLRFQAAASQLSASHFRQLRRFEIEETIKEHCVFLRLGSGDERHREGKKGRRLGRKKTHSEEEEEKKKRINVLISHGNTIH